MKRIDVIKKYHDDYGIKMTLIDAIYAADRTPTKKYVPYMLHHHYIRDEPISSLVKLCEAFEKYKRQMKNKDIYSARYSSLRKLRDEITQAALTIELKKKKKNRGNDVFVLEENDSYILLQPRTHEASRKYGYGTTWCTTSQHNDDYFNQYAPFLVYLIFKDTGRYLNKVAFYSSKGKYTDIHIYNPSDTDIGKYEFCQYVPEANHILKRYKRFIRRDRFKWIKRLIPNSFTSRDADGLKKLKKQKANKRYR